MKLHPWNEALVNADGFIKRGHDVYQQWCCQHCGAKQTMQDANHFYMFGDCEECNQRTDIKNAGMNFMIHIKIGNKR